MVDRNGSPFLASGKLLLHITYVRCPKEHEYVARLAPPVALLKGVSGLFDQVTLYMVLDQPYDRRAFLKIQRRWLCECDYDTQMQTACRPTFESWHDVQMFAVPHSGRGVHNVLVP